MPGSSLNAPRRQSKFQLTILTRGLSPSSESSLASNTSSSSLTAALFAISFGAGAHPGRPTGRLIATSNLSQKQLLSRILSRSSDPNLQTGKISGSSCWWAKYGKVKHSICGLGARLFRLVARLFFLSLTGDETGEDSILVTQLHMNRRREYGES